MSYYGKNDWRFRSNGLSKSSSQPNYLIPHELNKYNSNYLPLIRHHQQAEIFSNQIDKSNKIKNEILNSKYKFMNERGIDNYNRNKYKDSWNDFFKRKEREKERKKIYKIIQDKTFSSNEEENNANDIFRNGLNSMPTKIEDKIKLKRYLPAKKDLVKLMRKVNDNVNERVDKNSYLLSKNIRNLENGYDDLKEMIESKIGRMERKQEEDFQDLRHYFKRRAQRENNKFNNNFLLENGQNVYDNDYYKPNMKENIEKLQTYEIAKRIQNIPNLLDNMMQNIENIREIRKEQKNDFLLNFSNNFKIYDDPIDDELDYEMGGNNLRYNDYDKYYLGDYDTSEYDPDYSYMTKMTSSFKYKPKTDIRKKVKKDILSMSKTDIDKLRKNLKPLTYQMPKKKLEDDDDLLTGKDLMGIYKERNSIPKLNLYNGNNTKKSNKNINIQENKTMNRLKESVVMKDNDTKKEDTKEEKDDSDDIVVIDSSDKDKSNKSENNNKNKKEETKKNETQKQSNKKEEKKEENSFSDDEYSDKDEEDKKDDKSNNNKNNFNNNPNNNNNNVNNNANNNVNNNANNNENASKDDEDDNKDDDDDEDNKEDDENDDDDEDGDNNGGN